ncbi:ATP/GTP-binding protein [Demequina sp. NBRC 110054]|uniref:GTP-binding protein n=1 Tax=Demequina sp. NBRC 110054 TaxID=1570343 RepID=UPI0009FC9184|nr:ATP/GTP-binding protein [Demequina sp. NBRC 110054]
MSSEVTKIVIAGPFGAGKTTLVKTLSADAVGAERGVSDATSALKSRTTVAMDHGTVRLRDEQVITLFGMPGQERFSFMWPTLSKGMRAYALLVDASRLQAQAQLKSILRQFQAFAPHVPFLVAANRWDPAALSAEELGRFLGVDPGLIVACDPREKAQGLDLLGALMSQVDLAEALRTARA